MATGKDDFTEAPRLGDESDPAGHTVLRTPRNAAELGKLSAGVAHDFNKLLTIMFGYSELMLADISHGDEARPHVEQINHAVYQAARLTRYLLDFSHPHAPKMEALNLNTVVQDLDGFLRGLIGTGVDLVRDLTPPLRSVHADRKHLDQLLATLVLAARDASPTGGCITVETFNVILTSTSRFGGEEIPPGAYVCLGVREQAPTSSTGPGLAPPTMGSSIRFVHDLVHHNGGYFTVHHEPGQGRLFRVYLPSIEGA
jgi:two-component system cell cycle sensor histidine kinase/response regulator CckA